MNNNKFNFIVFCAGLILSACSYGKLTVTEPNGVKAEATINTLWNNGKLAGLTVKINPDGTKQFTLDSLDNNQTTGLDSFNKMLPGTVAAAIEAAFKGAGLSIGKPPLP